MTAKRTTLGEAFTPKPALRRDYLTTDIVVNGLIAVLVAVVAAALAVSRATNHHLTGVFTATMIAVGAALSAVVRSFAGVYTGMLDTTSGLVLPDDGMAEATANISVPSAMQSRDLWRRAGVWFALTLAWAGGLGLLLTAVINGRVVGFPVLFAGVVVANLLAGATAGAVSTARGIDYARATGAQVRSPHPMRRRAWAEIAPLLALIAFVGGVGTTLVLFHDYATGSTVAAHVLTRKEILRDLLLALLVNSCLMGFFAGRAGRSEAANGFVEFDDPITQRVPAKAALHRNAIGWAVFLLLIVVSVLSSLLPKSPSLLEAAVIRGAYSAAIAYIAAGLAYVRGAANTLGAASEPLEQFEQPALAGASA